MFQNSFRTLPPFFHEGVDPTPLLDPTLLHLSPIASELGLGDRSREELQSWLNGESRLPGDQRIATRYAGHQFGVWAGQLGDGRAISLGEILSPILGRQEIQIKGSGPTPFSRRGDGKAVLRSSIREYLAAEAMHALGIPSTRSLAILLGTGGVEREEVEPESITVRIFPTNLRFGHFEMAYHFGKKAELSALINYTLEYFFPGHTPESMLAEILDRTARMVALWQSVGFCHGVMNSDNFSILGLTIDYGPFGFLERFDPGHICNHSDHEGRYAYSEQPRISMWNLERLFVCFLDQINRERLASLLQTFPSRFQHHWLQAYRKKLGLAVDFESDGELIGSLLQALEESGMDPTRFFRAISSENFLQDSPPASGLQAPAISKWLLRYQERLVQESSTPSDRSRGMLATNPKYILRNWIADEIISSTSHSSTGALSNWFRILSRPFDEHPDFEKYAGPPPDGRPNRPVSCSS
jgi:uncharacterized protein YdiU (UPF0061 family)